MTTDVVADSTQTNRRQVHPAAALVLICVAQLMVVLDSTITNIALPYIKDDLAISQSNLSWVVTGYALAFGGLLLLGGRLGDLYGRRRVFMTGLLLFAAASSLGGLAQNEVMLLGSRALQGVGAAMASPNALALITTTFAPGPRRNRAFSVYAAMAGIGAAIGLILGGALTGVSPLGVDGWRWTFLINVPIGLVAGLLAPRVLPESDSHRGQLDLPGAITGTLGLVSLVYGITLAGNPDHGWKDGQTIGFLIAAVALLITFIQVERRVAKPLLPLSILKSRTRATAFVAMMLVPAAMFAMFFFLSQFVQTVMGYSPLHTGLAFLPFSVAMVFSAATASRLINRVDPRFIAGTGTILSGIALFNFHRLSVNADPANLVSVVTTQLQTGSQQYLGSTVNYWTDIFPFIILMALGMGSTFVPMTLSAVHGVPPRDAGVGSGVLNTMQQVGGALGLATLSTIAVHSATSRATELAGQVQQLVAAGGGQPPAGVQEAATSILSQAAFTHGATQAFLTGAFMVWTGSLIVWTMLNVKHSQLSQGHAPEGVHAG